MKINYKTGQVLGIETTQEEVSFMVEEQKLQLQANLLATKQSLAEAKRKLVSAKSEYPLNFEEIVKLQTRIESLTSGITCLESLKEEFGW